MSLGIQYGKPMHYLTSDISRSADKLAAWIEREVPCMAGNLPAEYKEAVTSYLMKNFVSPAVIAKAYEILAQRGTRFDPAPNDFEFSRFVTPTIPAYNPNVRQAPQMRAVSAGEAKRMREYTFEEYERKYVLAIKTNNMNEAEAIIAAVLELLWGVAKGYSKTKTAARNEKMVEWDEFNQAVDQALNRATTLQTHFRYMSREELNSLRSSPTPTAFRNMSIRFANRVTTRTMPRRARR